MKRPAFSRLFLATTLAVTAMGVAAQDLRKPASSFTAQANKAVGQAYDLNNQKDFEAASRGFVARMPDGQIKTANGDLVWDINRYDFVKDAAPDSVNPSMWRQSKLNGNTGLFKVTEGIWQVRGYDVSNMTLVSGKNGWIIIDPLTSAEVAKATLDFAMEHLGKRPVTAVIYTHSHADHFGGVRGVVDEADVKSGKVPIIAPEGFMEEAVAEFVIAGNAMTRRVHYMYGTPLPADERGNVGIGLGKTVSVGTLGLIAPTDIVTKTGEERVVDGVRIVFQMANGSEAPSEFNFYFPDFKALCMSEVVSAHMHNVYTLRGTKTRDALAWSKYINEMIDVFPDAEIAFRSHHWPVWGKGDIRNHLVNQRDMYRFLHDRAMNMANKGKKMGELGNETFMPKGLANDFTTHGYYGSLSHNLRAVYNFYLGYYDSNPATLNPHTPVESAKRYVQAFGGVPAIMGKAKAAMDKGDYRWAAELNNHAVMAEPGNEKARFLQADILEQMGYQAEAGPWRNNYLTGAQELRQGAKPSHLSAQGPDAINALTLDMIFDFIAVRMNHQKSDGQNVGVQMNFTDQNETYALELSNSVLNHTKGRKLASPNVALTLTRPTFMKMLLGGVPLPKLIEAGEIKVDGDPKALGAIFANMDKFTPLFNIVTP
ncbi:alkyl/aryl-sulfatase [Ottowia sp.]|uniref:alkyl/aryl-sulfatase n=1 Tax=Ottowia sp. TaxID=1898956 RepID=UPI003A8B415D